jgi:hypothetical protein
VGTLAAILHDKCREIAVSLTTEDKEGEDQTSTKRVFAHPNSYLLMSCFASSRLMSPWI